MPGPVSQISLSKDSLYAIGIFAVILAVPFFIGFFLNGFLTENAICSAWFENLQIKQHWVGGVAINGTVLWQNVTTWQKFNNSGGG